MRSLVVLHALLLPFVAVSAERTIASEPALPTTAQAMAPGLLVFNSNLSGNHEVYVSKPDGSGRKALTADKRYDSWWARVSPDRKHILFYRNRAAKRKEDYSQTSLWVMAADGSGATELRPVGADGWAMQGHAEWSPDGSQLIMFGGPKRHNPQIYITSNTGQKPRKVTDRSGQNLDPSWSSDGKQIVFVGCPSTICFASDYEVYTVSATDGKPAVRRTFDKFRDHDPYYSPDGKQVAWLTETEGVLARPPAGAWSVRLAAASQADWSKEGSYRWIINDRNINSYPAWSPDGKRVAFHRLVLGKGQGFGIFTINADGSDLRELPKQAKEICEYPSFSPGR